MDNRVPASCPINATPYIIQAGDTFYRLAQRFGTTVNALLAANPGIDPNRLLIGQRICIPYTAIPVVPPSKACPNDFTRYSIQPGDTLYNIANRFGVGLGEIRYYNLEVDENNLQVGQIICIPSASIKSPRCPAGLTPYTVQTGDTLYLIAQRRKTTIENILHYNRNIDPNNLQVGQFLCIP